MLLSFGYESGPSCTDCILSSSHGSPFPCSSFLSTLFFLLLSDPSDCSPSKQRWSVLHPASRETGLWEGAARGIRESKSGAVFQLITDLVADTLACSPILEDNRLHYHIDFYHNNTGDRTSLNILTSTPQKMKLAKSRLLPYDFPSSHGLLIILGEDRQRICRKSQ